MDTNKVIQDKLPVFTDNRGTIENITKEVIYIRSEPGAKRAAHFHKASGHLCYVTTGEILYFERPVGSTEKPKLYILKKGESFWTGPMIEHLMVFPTYTEFICLSTGCRDQKDYENDLVRLNHDLEEIYHQMS